MRETAKRATLRNRLGLEFCAAQDGIDRAIARQFAAHDLDFFYHHFTGAPGLMLHKCLGKFIARLIARYAAQRQACYKEFFAERCLSAARDQDNYAVRRISGVELEATHFQRQSDARKHAKELADRLAQQKEKEARERAEREKKRAGQAGKVQRNERQNAEFEAQTGEREKRGAESTKREQDRRAALVKKQQEERAQAPQREDRARERQLQVEETLKRAKEREAKEAEKKKAKAASPQPAKPPDLPGADAVAPMTAPAPATVPAPGSVGPGKAPAAAGKG